MYAGAISVAKLIEEGADSPERSRFQLVKDILNQLFNNSFNFFLKQSVVGSSLILVRIAF